MKTKHTFELHGYEKTKDHETLLDLREATISIDADGAEALAKFLLHCSKEMKANPSWEHEHFNGGGAADIVVFNRKWKRR